MANIRAASSGNWSVPATWIGGVVPTAGDNVSSNNFTVTIDVNATVDNLTNGSAYGATSGGQFVLNNNITLTANVLKNYSLAACVVLQGTNSASIVGNISGSTGGQNNIYNNNLTNPTILHTSTGVLNVTGNIVGGTVDTYVMPAIYVSVGTLNVTGSVTGGSGGNSIQNFCHGIFSDNASIINITGNVLGGNARQGNRGIFVTGNGILNVVGNLNAGQLSGCNAVASGGDTATVSIIGDIIAVNGINALSANTGNNSFSGNFIFSADGTPPIACNKYKVFPVPSGAKTRYALNGASTYVDMFTADNALAQANPTDVRSGVSYASGNLTGRLTVPARQSVVLSVNYGPSMPFTATRSGTTATATLAYSYPLVVGDQITVTGASNTEWNSAYTIASVLSGTEVTFTVPATHSATAGTGALMQPTGTAVLDPTGIANAVWGAATSGMITAGSIGERIKNCATTQSTGDQLASLI